VAYPPGYGGMAPPAMYSHAIVQANPAQPKQPKKRKVQAQQGASVLALAEAVEIGEDGQPKARKAPRPAAAKPKELTTRSRVLSELIKRTMQLGNGSEEDSQVSAVDIEEVLKRYGARAAWASLQASQGQDDPSIEGAQLQPIPSQRRRNKSGWFGVYPARNGRWQAQVCHHAIGGYATAWEAGTAVTAHLVRMAAIILSEAEREDQPDDPNAPAAASSVAATAVAAGGEAATPCAHAQLAVAQATPLPVAQTAIQTAKAGSTIPSESAACSSVVEAGGDDPDDESGGGVCYPLAEPVEEGRADDDEGENGGSDGGGEAADESEVDEV